MDGQRDSETPPHDRDPSPSEEYVATGGHVEDDNAEKNSMDRHEEEPVDSQWASAARTSPPVLSIPEIDASSSPAGTGASGSERSGGSTPGSNDTTIELCSEDGAMEDSGGDDGQLMQETRGARGRPTRHLPGGRIIPGSLRTRRSHQYCWLCRRDIPNALAVAHFSSHKSRTGHVKCPVCDTMYKRDRTSMQRHVRGHFLPYRFRCHRCGSESQTRVRLICRFFTYFTK